MRDRDRRDAGAQLLLSAKADFRRRVRRQVDGEQLAAPRGRHGIVGAAHADPDPELRATRVPRDQVDADRSRGGQPGAPRVEHSACARDRAREASEGEDLSEERRPGMHRIQQRAPVHRRDRAHRIGDEGSEVEVVRPRRIGGGRHDAREREQVAGRRRAADGGAQRVADDRLRRIRERIRRGEVEERVHRAVDPHLQELEQWLGRGRAADTGAQRSDAERRSVASREPDVVARRGTHQHVVTRDRGYRRGGGERDGEECRRDGSGRDRRNGRREIHRQPELEPVRRSCERQRKRGRRRERGELHAPRPLRGAIAGDRDRLAPDQTGEMHEPARRAVGRESANPFAQRRWAVRQLVEG